MKTMLIILLVMFAMSCASQQNKDQSPVENKIIVQKTLTARHSRWLPSDTFGLGVIDLRPLIEPALDPQQWGPNPKIEENQRLLREELAQLLSVRFGLDPTGLQYMIIGVGDAWRSVILGGVGLSLKPVKTEKFNGVEVFELQSSHELDQAVIEKFSPIWGVKVGEDAVAFFATRREMELAVSTPSVTLSADKERAKRFDEMLGSKGSYVSVAIMLDNPLTASILDAMKLPFERPDAVSAAVGEKMRLTFYGPKGRLEQMDAKLQELFEIFEKRAKLDHDARMQQDTMSALSSIATYRTIINYRALMTPTYKDNSLTYQALTPTPSSPLLLFGFGASIGFPAYMRAIKRSKVGEAQRLMRKLEQRVYAYQAKHQDPNVAQCALPPSTGPTSRVPTGGEEVKPDLSSEGWQALEVRELFTEPVYLFSFEIFNDEEGVEIEVKSDFKPGDAQHTMRLYIGQDPDEPDTCKLVTEELEVINDLQ